MTFTGLPPREFHALVGVISLWRAVSSGPHHLSEFYLTKEGLVKLNFLFYLPIPQSSLSNHFLDGHPPSIFLLFEISCGPHF